MLLVNTDRREIPVEFHGESTFVLYAKIFVFVSSQINSIGHKAIDNNQSGFANIAAKFLSQSQNTTENSLNNLQYYKLHKDFS